MKRSELVKAAKEINTIIEPPIDVKLGTDELEAELLEASEAVSEEDGLSEATMDILAQIQAKYADNEEEEEEEEDADEEEIDGDEETDDEDESDEGLDEEGEDGDEISKDEDVPDNIDIEEEEEEDEIEVLPIPKKGKGKGKVKEEKPAKSDKPKKTRDEIFKGNKTATRIEFFMDLINEGRYSKKDLIELAAKQFPDATISALSTIIYDGTNPKYCRFPVLIYIDKEDGNIVKFTDIKCERGSKITKEIVKHDGGTSSKKKASAKKEAPAKTTPAKEAKAGKKSGKKK